MFITLEGIEGSGKTTQVKHTVRFLEKRGHICVTTREPGGTNVGKKIRSILLDPQNSGIDPTAELLLYFADRVQHIKKIIKPSLSAGKTVICDRFFDATMAYQGYARGLDLNMIISLHKLILNGFRPDITILLDLDPEIGLSRAWKQINNGKRPGFESRFEKERLSFHKKVREGYLKLAEIEPKRLKIINASQDENQVRDEITEFLDSILTAS